MSLSEDQKPFVPNQNMSTEKKRSFVKVNEEELIEAIKDHRELYDCTDKVTNFCCSFIF